MSELCFFLNTPDGYVTGEEPEMEEATETASPKPRSATGKAAKKKAPAPGRKKDPAEKGKKAPAAQGKKAKKAVTPRSSTKDEEATPAEDAAPKKRVSVRSLYKDKTLVIVESPAKAKTINKYLGPTYHIEASMGHVIDLPKSRMAVDTANDFTPEYITVRGRAPILNRLKKAAEQAREVLLAADPDREGEAISFHLARAIHPKNPNIRRIEFNEITKQAVLDAVKHPREIDQSLVNAQQARRILDRLVGYSVSPILWKKIKRGLSAGRVQSVALRLVCEREAEIDAFVPEEYWTIDAKFRKDRVSFEAPLALVDGKKPELHNEGQVRAILGEIEGFGSDAFRIRSVQVRERRRQPVAPYTTSRMQQDASNRLGFTSQKTMMVAQQLYEGIEVKGTPIGLITYMRTDSTRISPDALAHVREFIGKEYGADFLSKEPRQYVTSKSSQDAHEAIRPSDPHRTPDSLAPYLNRDQIRLYRLIWQRFVSSQMADEVSDQIRVDIEAGRYTFRAGGKVVKFKGFTAVLDVDSDEKDEKGLPTLVEGEQLKLSSIKPEQHFTQPPARYTDASMVKILEESGVGRPSTYAPTIQTLLKRYYVTRLQRSFKPTDLGRLVNDMLVKNFPDMVDVGFTARMEDNLDRVARSDLNWVEMLRTFYSPFAVTVAHAMEHIGEMKNALDEPTDYVCEKCGRPMVKRIGRNGYFLACTGFPECRTARSIPLGRCPVCETGDVVQRSARRGRPFYGCSRYPDCTFSTWDKPHMDKVCPDCGKMLLEKSTREKGRHLACSACAYEESADRSA